MLNVSSRMFAIWTLCEILLHNFCLFYQLTWSWCCRSFAIPDPNPLLVSVVAIISSYQSLSFGFSVSGECLVRNRYFKSCCSKFIGLWWLGHYVRHLLYPGIIKVLPKSIKIDPAWGCTPLTPPLGRQQEAGLCWVRGQCDPYSRL